MDGTSSDLWRFIRVGKHLFAQREWEREKWVLWNIIKHKTLALTWLFKAPVPLRPLRSRPLFWSWWLCWRVRCCSLCSNRKCFCPLPCEPKNKRENILSLMYGKCTELKKEIQHSHFKHVFCSFWNLFAFFSIYCIKELHCHTSTRHSFYNGVVSDRLQIFWTLFTPAFSTDRIARDVNTKCKQGQSGCAQVRHATNITLLAGVSWSPTPPPLWRVLTGPAHTTAVLIIFLSNHLVAFGPSQAGQSERWGGRERKGLWGMRCSWWEKSH